MPPPAPPFSRGGQGRRYRAQGAPSAGRGAVALQDAARSSSPSWTPTATTPRCAPWPMPASSASRWSSCRASPARKAMDVLSSQANLAGYRAVIDAAAEYGRALPMMMTAAGTVPATQGVRHGRRRRRPAGDRDRAPPRRHRHRDRRAAGGEGAGREPRRQVHRGRGRRIQAPPRPPAATPRKCRRSTRPSRPRWSPNTSRSRTSSSPPRSFPAGRRRG